jgi:UDP-N-acetylmuramoyl-tripeptide--D-alanyl-D-alanine ligase
MTLSSLYEIFLSHPVITTDTRDCPAGSLFFALRGTTFDGNAFALQALASGCAYAVVDDATVTGDARLIHVDDVLQTLQQLAAHHRRQFRGPVLQITGTNGKTTTKELVAAVLGERFRVLYTQGNFNNHIGVPKTLLQLRADHDIAVVETGANHPGEIALLSGLVDADCGLITNVGKAHLEGFGSFDGVVRTKGELYDYLRERGRRFIFLHGDNPHLAGIAHDLRAVTYGVPGHDYDVEGEVVVCTPFLRLRWRRRGGEWQEVQTQLIGAYNIDNALAAAAVGIHFGVEEAAVSHALVTYHPTNSRSELQHTAHNTLIVDAYNANPTSMAAALDNFRRIEHDHKVAILGEMRELGTAADEEHRRIADLARASADEVWLVGEHFAPYADGCRHFADVDAVIAALTAAPLSGRLVLVKGSNGTHLFRLPPYL